MTKRIVSNSNVFLEAERGTEVRAFVSLPATVTSQLVLVDYAANGTTTPTGWPHRVWECFEERERDLLLALRPILVHGVALMEFLLDTVPLDSPVQQSWPAVRSHISALDRRVVQQLVVEGVVSGLDYYRQYMPPDAEIDRSLADILIAPEALLEDPLTFQRALDVDLRTWGLDTRSRAQLAELVKQPDRFVSALVELFEALWRCGAEASWNHQRQQMEAFAEQVNTRCQIEHWDDPLSALLSLTGLRPPDSLTGPIRNSERLILLPCPHLGTTLRVSQRNGTAFILFEPNRNASAGSFRQAYSPVELETAVARIRAMSDPVAFTLIQCLSGHDELYAQQIAAQASIHQSTVSRHLALLEQLGIVDVRKEGNAKYYRLRRERLEDAAGVMLNAIAAPEHKGD